MPTANIKTAKKCAFCKYWYDPTNSAISPRSPKINLWEYDDKCKKNAYRRIMIWQQVHFVESMNVNWT